MAGFKLEGNYRRFLEILGLDCSIFTPAKKLVRYDSIIVPDESFFCDDYAYFFTDEYKNMIDIVRDFAFSNYRHTKKKKIYCSYSKCGKGKVFGEDKLERYFSSKGYEIIYPEELSFDEQLEIFANCESFASTVGSCSHNSIFLCDDTEVILIPRASYMTGYQEALNQLHSQRINYIDSSFSIFTDYLPWGGPFLYFISSNLRRYFHDDDISAIIDVSDFMRYLKANPSASNPNAYKYYSVIATEYFRKLFMLRRNKRSIRGILRKAMRAVKKLFGFIR